VVWHRRAREPAARDRHHAQHRDQRALADPQLRERLSGEALEPMPMTPEQFGQYITNDIAKWTKVAKDRNIELTD
jgi:tripartite-type tricarboxylate transporter receptor subunit TctC